MSRAGSKRGYLFYLAIPLAIAAFTQLWNPIGFPSIHPDENTYLFHAIEVQDGKGVLPRGAPHYDHPFFGRIFLAAVLGTFGYPDATHPTAGNLSSIEMLHIVPRLVMGILAVIDTFLIYKIAERRYNKTVAFIAAILFAVMPISWLLRRILLDNLLLPLLLSSVLFAISLRGSSNYSRVRGEFQGILILTSGIFLGLAIFTKIPAFTFIPLVGFLVYTNSNRSFKALGLWIIPVVLVPLLWPLLAASAMQFDSWTAGITEQAVGRQDEPLGASLHSFLIIDPVLFIAGLCSIGLLSIKRDFLLALWVLPYFIFLYLLSFADIVHMVLIIPAFCIALGRMIEQGARLLSLKIHKRKISHLLPFLLASPIALFGLVSITLLIIANVNANYFLAYNFTVEYLATADDNSSSTSSNPTVLIGRYWTKSFLWISQLVFDKDFLFLRDDSGIFKNLSLQEIQDYRILLIADNRVRELISSDDSSGSDREIADKLRLIYDNTESFRSLDDTTTRYDRDTYPYTSMPLNRGIGDIEMRINQNGTT
jgi:hypothetical protein